ncbi:MAG: Flp family type IVb pilin [Deltaproteobacteria bacterium]|nr:Flp family type IVb pilin [Deltaproteobacteria bacterium]
MKTITTNPNTHRLEKGAAMLEYALLITLIGIALIGSVTLLGQQVEKTFEKVSNDMGAGGIIIDSDKGAP